MILKYILVEGARLIIIPIRREHESSPRVKDDCSTGEELKIRIIP